MNVSKFLGFFVQYMYFKKFHLQEMLQYWMNLSL